MDALRVPYAYDNEQVCSKILNMQVLTVIFETFCNFKA